MDLIAALQDISKSLEDLREGLKEEGIDTHIYSQAGNGLNEAHSSLQRIRDAIHKVLR